MSFENCGFSYINDLLWQSTVWSCVLVSNFDKPTFKWVHTSLGRGGQNGWEVEEIAKSGVSKNVVSVLDNTEVANQLGKSNLVIDDEEDLSKLVSLDW